MHIYIYIGTDFFLLRTYYTKIIGHKAKEFLLYNTKFDLFILL